MDEIPHLTNITVIVSAALLFGLMLIWLKQTAIVGYILAGAVMGPAGLALITDDGSIRVLAELGVLLLLFLIGMELSIRELKTHLRVVSVTVAMQIFLSLAATAPFIWILDWPVERTVLIGFVIAISSTAVTVKILQDMGERRSEMGKTVIGVMIGQDLAIVPMLMIIRAMQPGSIIDGYLFGRLFFAAICIVGIVWFLAKTPKFHLPFRGVLAADQEVVPLVALCACFVAAMATGLLGLSSAFGAFLAGLVIGNSTEKSLVQRNTRPIQSLLMVVFFLSVGLLLDIQFILQNVWRLVALVLFVTVIKGGINIVALRLARVPWERAVLAGVTMGQIGEFSFVLAGVGLTSDVISHDGYKFAVAVIAISLMLGPIWATALRRLQRDPQLAEFIKRVTSNILELKVVKALRRERKNTLPPFV